MLGVDVHGSNLDDPEQAPVSADAVLAEQRRAGGGETHRSQYDHQYRHCSDEEHGSENEVDSALGGEAMASVPMLGSRNPRRETRSVEPMLDLVDRQG